MRILIVGYGSIAKRHLINLGEECDGAELAVLRLWNKSQPEPPAQVCIERFFFDIDAAIAWNPKFVFITSPATTHVDLAKAFLSLDCSIYVEKPISHSLTEVVSLREALGRSPGLIMVGYHLRFHPAYKALKQAIRDSLIGDIFSARIVVGQWLPDWRGDSDYRMGVTAQRSLGGGALLELSHEIDYAIDLFGPIASVQAMSSRRSDLDIDVEDSVDILLEAKSGVQLNMHLDILQRNVTRYCTIVGEQGTLELDFLASTVKIYEANSTTTKFLYQGADEDGAQAYKHCLAHFFKACERSESCLSTVETAEACLVCVEAARASAEKRSQVLI